MCGICGFVARTGHEVDGSHLREAVSALGHRGPDSSGVWGVTAGGQQLWDDHAVHTPLVMGLGHTRLAVFDPTPAGAQPMSGPADLIVAYNGEIYNFPEIKRRLDRKYEFRTATDTEVLLAAWAEQGEACLHELNGMWAFAMADVSKRTVTLCRDRLGVKPLYYSATEAGVFFASEPEALFILMGRTPEPDMNELARWLVYHAGDDGPETIYCGIKALSGGGLLSLAPEGVGVVRRWWRLPDSPDLMLSDAEALDTFEELFEDSVRLRLRSDRPTSVLLSGGTDSAAVTLAASRVGASSMLCATSSFPGVAAIDEAEAAASVARACGAQHYPVRPDVGMLLDTEPVLTRRQGAPYGTLSLFVHWALLSGVRSQGVPVVLSGQGGDELFLGYERYHAAYALSQLPNVPAALRTVWKGGGRSRPGVLGLAAQSIYFSLPGLRPKRLQALALRAYDSDFVALAPSDRAMVGGDRRALQASEITGAQLGQLLRYDDRTSAALGMETRLPFLDWRLVEFAYRLPWKHKIRRGWGKWLIRRYLDRHGLQKAAWDKRKLGFEAPQEEWVANLIAQRGEPLASRPLAKRLLRPGVRLEALPVRLAWDAYNTLHLARIGGWDD